MSAAVRPRRWRRLSGAAIAGLGAVLGLVAPPASSAPAAAPAAQDDPSLTLVAQTPTVEPGGTSVLLVRLDEVPTGASLRVAVHDRVRSRTELARTFAGEGLRSALHSATVDPASLVTESDGTVRLDVDLGATSPFAVVRTPGVYPMSVEARDTDGDRVARLVTHLVLRPPLSDAAPPLDVAVVARVGASPAPPGRPPFDQEQLAAAQGLVDALATTPDVVVTLAPTPDTLAGLAGDGGGAATALLEDLRAVAARAPTLALPYVTTSPDALAEAGLARDLADQLTQGATVQRQVLGVAPTQASWLAGPDLGADGLALLDGLGVRRVVVRPDQVELAGDGVLTPAGPFEVVAPTRRGSRGADAAVGALDAMATDARLDGLLDATRIEPALQAGRVLADLAMLWFERPGTARAVVLPVDAAMDGTAARAVLEGLRAQALFRPVAIDDAFRDAEPLTDGRGEVLRRTLVPEDPDELGDEVATGVGELRELGASLEGMLGGDAPELAELRAHALRAAATGLDRDEREQELRAGAAAVDELAGAIRTPSEASVTLTAREGRVPLTIRNETGRPVDVRIHLSSPKLELPGGETLTMTLEETTNRLDIPVRTRASGSFPFQVEVTSPDGRILLASTTYSVRSTAVSGVGLVLSAGAGLFLIVWWARHWRATRRSVKLVADA